MFDVAFNATTTLPPMKVPDVIDDNGNKHTTHDFTFVDALKPDTILTCLVGRTKPVSQKCFTFSFR